ncbi:MAG TPA: carbohydrate kinase family protein [Anaerolineales bacterium]|nr:carbohydrate kinase family protein [Anaerolineales bacterium]
MTSTPPSYVGFGLLTPVVIAVVDQLPEHNTGAVIKEVSEFVFDDAAIVACLLRQWGVPSAIIGSAVGDDFRGHHLADQLSEWGVQADVRFTREYHTPYEVDVSDSGGARTYFWQRSEKILATLDSADLSPLRGSRILYVDWYDGDHILRAMDEATRLGIPVFLNFEHGHVDAKLLERYAGRATVCQAVTDAAQLGQEPPLDVARKLLRIGVKTALITLAGEGSLALQGTDAFRIHAPKVTAVDGCGAGATFSAGYIYGFLQGWSFADSLRFATAAASLKVTRAGLEMFPVERIQSTAAALKAEQLQLIGTN